MSSFILKGTIIKWKNLQVIFHAGYSKWKYFLFSKDWLIRFTVLIIKHKFWVCSVKLKSLMYIYLFIFKWKICLLIIMQISTTKVNTNFTAWQPIISVKIKSFIRVMCIYVLETLQLQTWFHYVIFFAMLLFCVVPFKCVFVKIS